MRAPLLLLTVLAAACAAPPSQSRVESAPPPFSADARLDSLLEAARAEAGIPGLAAIVVRADTVLRVEAAGVRRLGAPAPLGTDDRFHLGSLAKAVTATLVAGLVEDGTLSWSTRAADVFPEWADSISPGLRAATLEQMLRHTSGILPYEDDAAPEFAALGTLPADPVQQRRAVARAALAAAPLFAPGTDRRYSNGGFVVAAAMAERATGRPWEALVRERVFAPLGITTAGFGWPAAGGAAQPWGHLETASGLEPLDPDGDLQLPAWHRPAGDIHLSPRDYARFMQAHLRGLRGRDGIVRASTIRHLHTPLGGPNGLGWGVRTVDGLPRSTHNGGTGLFYAVVALDPARDLGIAVFANSDRADDEAAANRLLAALLALYPATAAPADR
jgi:CubicO group peptidase (beta-lactamase class C family)